MEGAAFTAVELEEGKQEYALSLSCPKLDLCSGWIAAEGDKGEKNERNLEREERKISHTPVRTPLLTKAQLSAGGTKR